MKKFALYAIVVLSILFGIGCGKPARLGSNKPVTTGNTTSSKGGITYSYGGDEYSRGSGWADSIKIISDSHIVIYERGDSVHIYNMPIEIFY